MNTEILLSTIVGWLVVALGVIIVLLGLVTVRQVSLMNKVINVPIGGWFKLVAWLFLVVAIVVTAFSVLLI